MYCQSTAHGLEVLTKNKNPPGAPKDNPGSKKTKQPKKLTMHPCGLQDHHSGLLECGPGPASCLRERPAPSRFLLLQARSHPDPPQALQEELFEDYFVLLCRSSSLSFCSRFFTYWQCQKIKKTSWKLALRYYLCNTS